ncbi:MAG TPA: nucleotidyltransferase [Verrucomicrobiae bacterium]|nr:nucleotidyltransferase [Verrucomicrobiae bacterium]
MASESKRVINAGHFSPDTLEFIRLLQKHDVRYVIVGGEAVIFRGHARFTGHVDFFYATDQDNAEHLFAALKEFWQGNIPEIDAAVELESPGYVIQFGRPPNRIDLLTSVDGLTFQEAWQTRLDIEIVGADELRTSLLSLEKLIQNKRAAARPKDLDDLAFLEGLRGA